MRKRKVLSAFLISFIATLSISIVALAAYSANILVENLGATNYSMASCNTSANVSYLAETIFESPDGLDTRVMRGTVEVPHMLADDKILFSVPINAYSSQTLNFTTGNINLTDFHIIPGAGGNFTVVDDSNIELGKYFSTEISGWFQSDDVGNLFDKSYAYNLSGDGAGNVTATIYGSSGAVNITLYPVATGNYTNITSQTPAATEHWDKVDDTAGAPDDIVTTVSTSSATYLKDAYELTDANLPNSATINTITVTMRIGVDPDNPARTGYVQPHLWLDGNETAGTESSQSGDLVVTIWSTKTDVFDSNDRPGGGTWTAQDIDDLQLAVGIHISTTVNVYLTQAYVVVNYYPGTSITATGVTTGEHTITNGETPALSFDGAGDYALIGNTGDLGNTYSIEMWVYSDATPVANKGLFSSSVTIGEPRILWQTTDRLHAIGDATQSIPLQSLTAISNNEWHHLVFTFNNRNLAVWVDGAANGANLTDQDSDWATDGHAIGIRDGLVNGAFDGLIDQVRIWDRILTDAEIPEHYLGVFSNNSSLVALWNMDENTGNQIFDTSGNSRTANITGATWGNGLFSISVDGVRQALSAGATVPDNANAYTIAEAAVMPYTDNVTITINGTIQATYNPNTIIESNILPDRTGGDNPGTFNWGTNLISINITLAQLTSDYVSSVSASSSETLEVAPVITTPAIASDIAKRTALDSHPFIELAIAIESASNNKLSVLLQFWMAYLIIALILFGVTYAFFNNLIVSGIFFILPFGFGISQSIMDWWLIPAMVLWVLGCVAIEGRRSMG